MPRKTDGLFFELQPRPTKGDDGKPLLYAEPVIERKYDLDDIDDFCARYRHTSRGDWIAFVKVYEPLDPNVRTINYIVPEGEPFKAWGANLSGAAIPLCAMPTTALSSARAVAQLSA